MVQQLPGHSGRTHWPQARCEPCGCRHGEQHTAYLYTRPGLVRLACRVEALRIALRHKLHGGHANGVCVCYDSRSLHERSPAPGPLAPPTAAHLQCIRHQLPVGLEALGHIGLLIQRGEQQRGRSSRSAPTHSHITHSHTAAAWRQGVPMLCPAATCDPRNPTTPTNPWPASLHQPPGWLRVLGLAGMGLELDYTR